MSPILSEKVAVKNKCVKHIKAGDRIVFKSSVSNDQRMESVSAVKSDEVAGTVTLSFPEVKVDNVVVEPGAHMVFSDREQVLIPVDS